MLTLAVTEAPVCEGFGCFRRSFGPRGPSVRGAPKTTRGRTPLRPLATPLLWVLMSDIQISDSVLTAAPIFYAVRLTAGAIIVVFAADVCNAWKYVRCQVLDVWESMLTSPIITHLIYPWAVRHLICVKLTRAPLGYFYTPPPLGDYFESPPPPLISETTGQILKIQVAFESPGKTVEGKQIVLTSGSRVTSQVRSKSTCSSTFRVWWHRRSKLRC